MTALFSSTPWPAWVLFGIPLLGILLGLIAGWAIQRWLRPSRTTPTPSPGTTATGDSLEDDGLAAGDGEPRVDDGSTPGVRSSAPPAARGTPAAGLHDERPRDALAALLVGDPSTVEGASGERRATGQPGWPNLGGVGRPTVPPGPNEPATGVPGATSSTAASPAARTPDAFSSHPEDRNIHRQRWLERSNELMDRLDAAHEGPPHPASGAALDDRDDPNPSDLTLDGLDERANLDDGANGHGAHHPDSVGESDGSVRDKP